MFSQKIFPEIMIEPYYKLQFDGCSKGNPGLSGAGAVIYKNEIEIWSSSLFVGNNNTNNEAEYTGLIIGLKQAIKMNIKKIHVEGDSLLVIKQIKGEYKVNAQNLQPLFNEALALTKNFEQITFQHIFRNKNKRADQLSNIAIEILPQLQV
jgi:ribonuclease HI